MKFFKANQSHPPGIANVPPSKNISLGFMLTKRHKIIIASILITIGLILSTQTTSFIFVRYRLILGLGVIAYALSLWALCEGMTKVKAIVLLILPTLYAIGVASFYFLLPVRWLTRLPVAVIFGASFYLLLLAQNVFNVASSTRTIPLYRAAITTGFLFTLITAFFLFNVVSAFDLPFYWNSLVVFVISFVLILQLLWAIELEKITPQIFTYAMIIALIVGESAVALSFWPVAPTIWSLFLSTIIYVLVGIIMEFLKERLSSRIVLEYIGVWAVVIVFSVLVTSWT